ncbi:Momilactone A synthase [Linum grandiflorum]
MYTASKHALVGLMKNMCVELGPSGIRLNSISPAGVLTPMIFSATGMDRKTVQAYNTQKVLIVSKPIKLIGLAYTAVV